MDGIGKQKEHENVAVSQQRLPPSQRIRNWAFAFFAVMIGFGQWNDTKELATSLYEDAISSFTNIVEYKALSSLAVGISRTYLEQVMGPPKVIKQSEIDKNVQYEYIFNDKYLLTTLFRFDRLVGYSVIALQDNFSPTIPFSTNANNETGIAVNERVLAELSLPAPASYTSDHKNITFYIENHSLDITGLFLNRSVGYVSYRGTESAQLSQLIAQALEAEMFEQDDSQTIAQIRQIALPNFYSIGDIDPQFFAEALLTKYEYFKFK